MNDLKKRIECGTGKSVTMKRFLAQMARELVLFQASDWAFMIHNHSAEDYARARLSGHYDNVCKLYADAVKAKPDTRLLKTLEQKNNLFPWIGALV